MSAPTLQAEGTTAAVTSGNLAITLPTYAANDIVIINTVGWVPNTTTGTNTQSLASPWTKYSPNVTSGSPINDEYAIWWARATSASSLGTSVTITRPTSWDTGTDTCWGGRAYVIRGCKTTGDPFDAWTASAINTAANAAFPGVSYTAGNNLVIQFLAVADNTSVGTAPSGWTAGTEDNDAAGTDCTFQTFRQVFSTSGTATSTASTSSVAAPGNTGAGYVFFGVSFTDEPIARTASDTGTGSESASGTFWTTFARTASDTGTGSESATGKKVVLFQRTASDTGTGSESATGVFFSVFQRTASDTGTGTEAADATHFHTRTGSSTGTGTESASGTFFSVEARTASDTGTGSESATFNIVPGHTTHQVTASASGTGTETAVAVRVVGRTASDTGTGTETVSRLVVRFRTASDTGTGTASATGTIIGAIQRTASASGTGTESATPNVIAPVRRTATATGTGTESAAPLAVRVRTASDTGVGTQTTVTVLTALRTASGTGLGASSVTSARALFRTADASGAGTQVAVGSKLFSRTATATGTGTETPATWDKSLIFRPPTNDQYRLAEYLDHSPAGKLFGKVSGGRADNIYKLTNGSFVTVDPMDATLVDKIYLGGHNNFVTAEEKVDLVAAGYTVT